jgi:SAM domain (Sterile alpha motif)
MRGAEMALGGHAPPGDNDTTMSIDIAEWLHDLGMARYAEAFAENAVDSEVLPKLTSNDLREIGWPSKARCCRGKGIPRPPRNSIAKP